MRVAVFCPQIESIPTLTAIQDYRAFFAQGESHTPKAKAYDLDHFVEFLIDQQLAGSLIWEVTPENIREFVNARLRVEAPSTVDRRLSTVRHLFNYYARKFPGFYPPTKHVRSLKVQKGAAEGFKPGEMTNLGDAVAARYPDEFRQSRAKVILELGRFLGLRLAEMRELTVGQFDPLTGTLRDVRRKGNVFKTFSLDEQNIDQLLDYLPHRETRIVARDRSYLAIGDKGAFPLLVSAYGASASNPDTFRMNEKTIYWTIRHLGKAAQLSTRSHPHKLRHTCAHEMLAASGNDIALVADYLSHSQINTTRAYLNRGMEAERAVQAKRRQM